MSRLMRCIQPSIPPCTSEAKESRELVFQCSDKMSVSTYITIWLLISTQISYEENNWRKLKQRCKHFPNLCEEILKQAQEKGYKLKTDNLEQEADLMLAKDEQQHWGVKTLNKRTEQIEKQQEKELEQQQQHQANIYIDQDTILEQKVQESLEKLKDTITTTTVGPTTQTDTLVDPTYYSSKYSDKPSFSSYLSSEKLFLLLVHIHLSPFIYLLLY